MAKNNDLIEPQSNDGQSRREALRALALGGFAAAVLSAFPLGNEADAEENTGLMRRELRRYSEDPNTRGIGIFINLQRDGTEEDGERLGNRLREIFAARGIPVEYRINHSRGTATDLTFYVGGYDFTINVADLASRLGRVYAHHQDIWVHGRATGLNSLDQ